MHCGHHQNHGGSEGEDGNPSPLEADGVIGDHTSEKVDNRTGGGGKTCTCLVRGHSRSWHEPEPVAWPGPGLSAGRHTHCPVPELAAPADAMQVYLYTARGRRGCPPDSSPGQTRLPHEGRGKNKRAAPKGGGPPMN